MQALAQPLSSDAFFREALQGLSAAEIIQVNPVDFPWLEGLDLRTETRDFDLDQQEITLRISPSTPQEASCTDGPPQSLRQDGHRRPSRVLC